jgi:hypothetical protein
VKDDCGQMVMENVNEAKGVGKDVEEVAWTGNDKAGNAVECNWCFTTGRLASIPLDNWLPSNSSPTRRYDSGLTSPNLLTIPSQRSLTYRECSGT